MKECSLLFSLLLFLACTSTPTPQNNPAPEESAKTSEAAKENPTPQEKVLPSTQKLESGKLNPVDEGQLSPDFARFRQELLAAVERKDLDFILQIIDENIKVSFGGENGKEWFLKVWELEENPGDSRFWQYFKKVLQLGGTFERQESKGFMAPYPFSTWPEGIDVFEYTTVVGENVRVREAPGLDSKILTALSYDIVGLVPVMEEPREETIDGETWPWVGIILPDNSRGYVYGKYLHSGVDYRAYFIRTEGRWKLQSFLAGD